MDEPPKPSVSKCRTPDAYTLNTHVLHSHKANNKITSSEMHVCAAEHTWKRSIIRKCGVGRRKGGGPGSSGRPLRGFLSCVFTVTECGYVGVNSLLLFKLNLHVFKNLIPLCFMYFITYFNFRRNESQ